MNWELFWVAFGAIGGTFGGIATAVAVIVALWQTKFSQRKKARLRFYDTAIPLLGGEIKNYVALSITNIGNREIVVNNWGIRSKKRQFIFLSQTINDSFISRMNVVLPHTLQIEESITLYHPQYMFHAAILNGIAENQLSPSKRLKMYFRDSTGKDYVIKTPKPASYYIANHAKGEKSDAK